MQSLYLASLSCLTTTMRMVAMATITIAAKGSVTARAIVHSSVSAGLVPVELMYIVKNVSFYYTMPIAYIHFS